MSDNKNSNAGIQICSIFNNFPEESFTYRQILDRTQLPKGTVKSRIRRLLDDKIIKRYKKLHGKPYHYKLLDKKRAIEYIECRLDPQSSTKARDTPTLPITTELANVVPQVPHHKIQQVKLTDQEWDRTKHLFTKPKDNKDRGNQQVLERKTFKIVISPNTLNGAFYILEDEWRGELQSIYPELTDTLSAKEELSHLGVSFDAEVWQNFRMQSEDMKLLFATSHFWRELDVEGREVAVNSFMKRIMQDSFDKTTYDGIIAKLIEQMLIKQEGFDENMFQQIKVLQNIDEKLDRVVEVNAKMIEVMNKISDRLSGDKKKVVEGEENDENAYREMTPEDHVMFG